MQRYKPLKMTTGTENSNLLAEFEEAFKETMSTLTQEDTMFDRSPETLQHELENKVLRFTEIARQLETFFSQKRFLLYSHKPEMILKEDSDEMKRELLRKDELIKKHYEKLGDWQALLQDMQGATSTNSSSSGSTTTVNTGSASAISGSSPRVGGGSVGVTPGMNIPTPSESAGGQPSGFVPGNNYRTNLTGTSMQTPLAYLDSMARK